MSNYGKGPRRFSQMSIIEKIFSNQAVLALFTILLISLIILIFTQIGYIFQPVVDLFGIVGFPFIGGGVLYYLFIPIIEILEKRGIHRNISIWIIFLIITVLLVWGSLALFPILRDQTNTFIESLPFYIQQIGLIIRDMEANNGNTIEPNIINNIINSIDVDAITSNINQVIQTSIENIGGVIGTFTEIIMGIVTVPVILYYLLLQGQNIPNHLLRIVPTQSRGWFKRVLYNCNYQISQYIRGQIIVAIIVGIMFAVLFAIIGLDYAVSLSVLAGVLNVIPYLGSIIAFIPAFVIAIFMGPVMVMKFLVVVLIEQTLEGRIVQPQILGNNMQIHPVTILIILLAAGKLFGLAGVILGVPIYAVIKVVVKELFYIYQVKSGLYDDTDIIGVDTD